MHSRFAVGREAGRDQPQGRELLDVVERRPADDGLLPQHDRPAHRDDRQPDADRDPVPAAKQLPDSNLHFPIAPQQPGTSASRSTIRSRPTTRSSTSPRATGRTSSTTSTRWGRTRSSAATATAGRPTPRRVIAAQAARQRRRPRRRARRGTPGGDEPDAAGGRGGGRGGGGTAGGFQAPAARSEHARSARLHPARRISRISRPPRSSSTR